MPAGSSFSAAPLRLRAERRPDRRKGMTLLELIVVIVILAILAAIAIPTFAGVVTRSQDAAMKTTLTSYSNDVVAYAAVTNSGTITLADLTATAGDLVGAAGSGVLASGVAYTVVVDPEYATFSPPVISAAIAGDNLSAGLAGVSASGDCVLTKITAGSSTVESWVDGKLGANCVGSVGLAGPGGPTPPYVAPVVPAAPTLSGTAGDMSVDLSWNAQAGDRGYDVYQGVAHLGHFGAGTTSDMVTGLTDGTPYTFTVTATNITGTSPVSAPLSLTPTLVLSAPATPAGLSVTAGASLVTLAWTPDATSLHVPVTGYNVYRSTTSASAGFSLLTDVVGASSAGFSDSSVANGTEYWYQVTAFGAGGESAASPAQATTPEVPLISTVAGDGVVGYSGDGGPATAAEIGGGNGVAVANGVLYTSDATYGTIHAVNLATGIISTVAGIAGLHGNSGDGGPATSAELSEPTGITAADGILYIADAQGCVVRAVNLTTGVIATVAGDGSFGSAGDGGLATSAELSRPYDVFAANGILYIADTQGARVRAVNIATGIISTVAGNGVPGYSGDGGQATAAELDYPYGVTVSNGSLYIGDIVNGRVRAVDLTTGVIATVAGNGGYGYSGDGGQATSAAFTYPTYLAASSGTLYISDDLNNVVRAVNLSSGIITTVAGTGTAGSSGVGGPAASAELYYPGSLAVANGVLYIGGDATPVVYAVTPLP